MNFNALDRFGIKSKAKFVEHGYGQVEPNHLSAQRTGQIYAQLPAAADIEILENGQFAKYNYKDGIVDLKSATSGEWMLVYNEIKLYREGQSDCEFAMIKDNYNARVYSPLDADTLNWDKQSRYYNGVDAEGNTSISIGGNTYKFDDVTAGVDPYELNYEENPFHIESRTSAKMMPEGTKMVPRLLKTNVGDIYTTNCIDEDSLAVGDIVSPTDGTGYLSKSGDGTISWQVVKIYTMPDRQKAVKLIRVE